MGAPTRLNWNLKSCTLKRKKTGEPGEQAQTRDKNQEQTYDRVTFISMQN